MIYTMMQACGETDKDAPVVMESPTPPVRSTT